MSDELYLEGATLAQEQSVGGMFTLTVWVGEPPASARTLRWTKLRDKPFASQEEAWHWMHANAERFVRDRIVGVRLLHVVARYIPNIVPLFSEATPAQIDALKPKKPSATGTLQYGDVPGDEWKRKSDEEDADA